MLTEEEIKTFMERDSSSMKKKMAKVGQRYYDAEHDIMDYRMFYYNADGQLVEDTYRTNTKISHPFFTELVDQAVQYMLSGEDGIIHSDIPELQSRLDEYFDDDFICELNDVLTGTMSKGFEYMYAYMNKNGRLSFECADSLGVIEVRERDTDDGCAYVIYWYIDKLTRENKTIKRIQVWDENETHFYVQENDGKLMLDDSEPINPRPHIIYTKENDKHVYFDNFGFIPFFRLDNNKKQWSSLKPIKDLIDDYDIMSCGLSNNLADFDYPIHVVKGFNGNDLDELQTNLKTKKMIGVDADGGLEVHTVDIPHEARKTKMDEDEKNIYRFGMGFNSAQVGDGNVTNVVIKSRYALLDLKCNKLEIRLKKFLKSIIKVVIDDINRNDKTAYNVSDVWFDFDREVMTNASDNAQIELTDAQKRDVEINTIMSLNNVLDNETIIQYICDVLDLDYDDIKDRLPKGEDEDIEDNKTAQTVLDGMTTDE